MALWADLDAHGRAALVAEIAPGVVPQGAVDYESPIEPIWRNPQGELVDIDGRVLPVVTLRDPRGSNRLLFWAALAGLALVFTLR